MMRLGLVVVSVVVVALFASAAVATDVRQGEAEQRRVVETLPGVTVRLTQDEMFNLVRNKVGFMDVTEHPDLGRAASSLRTKRRAIPDEPTQQTVVCSYLNRIDTRSFQNDLEEYTSFPTRYYQSSTGVQASDWLFNRLKAYAGTNRSDITITKFTHSWPQPSVIARIQGTSPRRDDVVILGAHLDSINSRSPATGAAPGVNDDGSGTITVLEVFRGLVAGGFRPEVTLEFQLYAAEEVGLLGSQDIAEWFVDNNVDVRAMVQLDMTGYDVKEQNIGIINDFTDASLNEFLRQLVDEYLLIGWVNTACGYACSDHASFDKAGFPAAHPYESSLRNGSPYLHTTDDTMDNVSIEHMLEMIKLAYAYVIELSVDN